MKILFISPSAGDTYYCGNCFRDALQAQALQQAGHEVTVMPLYLPMKYASEGVPVFFPATSYFIEQAAFRKKGMPGWLRKATSAGPLLKMASSLSGTTSSAGMEGMTLSMIGGEGGAFRKNVQELMDWMRSTGLPDVMHLSSTLLLGIARPIREELGVPVVCSLQDEEVWLDGLEGAYSQKAWDLIRENARFVNHFVTTSQYYREVVNHKLPEIKNISMVYPGVDLERYKAVQAPQKPTIGFFYRMNRLDGLDLLSEAFVALKRKGSIPGLQLRIGGGFMGKEDKRFLEKVKAILEPFKADVAFDEYAVNAHAPFFGKITVLSVPLRFQEGVGLYVCEAFAAGVPVVEPETGSFPEIVNGAGVLYDPSEEGALAASLERLLTDASLMEACRQRASVMARERYNAVLMAKGLETIYLKQIHKNV